MGKPGVITVLSQKGGAGKSTLTMQLAGGLARAGRRVAIIDLDPQETSLRWAQSADPATPFPAHVVRLEGEPAGLHQQIKAARKCVDHVLLDCPPSIEHAATLAELAGCGFGGTCLVEKPIFAAAAQTPPIPGFRTVVGYPLRFHPLLGEARRILAGKPLLSLHAYVGQYLPTWRPGTDYRACYSASREQGGGVLRDLSHELDYLQHLGGPWKRVCATGGHRSRLEIETEDQFALLAELAACPDVVCHMDYLSRVPRRFCAVQYEGGTLWLDFIENRLAHNDQIRWLQLERNDMIAGMHEAAFAPATVPSPLCSWDEALDTLKLVEAAEQSAQQGKWICHPNR